MSPPPALALSGALLLSQLGRRSAGVVYTLMVSPLLTPGIIIGISTVILWRNFGTTAGLFTAILAQSAFIASYAMLMFMARLQRQDHTLEEAALDLGATRARAFRRITLPFLKPTIVTAAVIAFLQSFENYNTSVFTLSHYTSFTVEVAQKVRLGIDPTTFIGHQAGAHRDDNAAGVFQHIVHGQVSHRVRV